jgi:hypothetical protein
VCFQPERGGAWWLLAPTDQVVGVNVVDEQ